MARSAQVTTSAWPLRAAQSTGTRPESSRVSSADSSQFIRDVSFVKEERNVTSASNEQAWPRSAAACSALPPPTCSGRVVSGSPPFARREESKSVCPRSAARCVAVYRRFFVSEVSVTPLSFVSSWSKETNVKIASTTESLPNPDAANSGVFFAPAGSRTCAMCLCAPVSKIRETKETSPNQAPRQTSTPPPATTRAWFSLRRRTQCIISAFLLPASSSSEKRVPTSSQDNSANSKDTFVSEHEPSSAASTGS